MFDSAKQKIERAENHISELKRQFSAFVAEKPHKFVVQSDANSGELLVTIRFLKDPPMAFAAIIGDAFHNLRCALDHMTWEIVGISGTQDRYLKFPTGDNRVNFEASCNGVKTPDQWVKDAIRALEAFPGGKGSRLYEIHLLDNADKHTAISPVLRATGHPPVRAYHPDGKLALTMEGNVFVGGAQEGIPLFSMPPGGSIELGDDAQCPPSIFSRKASNGHYVPTVPFLKDCSAAVKDALNSVEKAAPF